MHDETRIGCKAMVYLKKKEDGWIISRFIKDHNHVLFSPRSSKFLWVHRKKSKEHIKLIGVLHDSGLCTCKITSVFFYESGNADNVGFSQQDLINYLTGKRQKQLQKGMLSWCYHILGIVNWRILDFLMHFKWIVDDD